ncbi:Glycosyl transferases group 1 [Gemmata sp. SH-PL17]|uniref:glycosyltransferase n=1 Tax=Gemmata sp. SH-PL17 TaxID=1630693 RepID=UPI00078C122A|nr:glycosyltransferase [Gemmata sp. SH-PL17]AMV25185.1 Glycosyl transferases group 1 [Gemmata sp. SH-PL17]
MSEPKPGLLFASYHAYLDHASGAALATRDLFENLTAHGWACRVVCGPVLDYRDGRGPEGVLHEHRVPYLHEHCAPPGGARYSLFHYTLNGVPVTQYRPEGFDPGRPVARDEGISFLDVVSRACDQFRPALGLTYGGGPLAPLLIRRLQRRGTKVLFCLHNTAYQDPELLRAADALWCPSRFGRDAYRTRLGVTPEVVPWPWDQGRVIADRADPRFVTFVNPVPDKGMAWVARMAAELYARRPEIPFLVVEGRGALSGFQRVPLDLSALRNVHGMNSTPRPKEFYAQSRAVLIPSLCEDMYPRVACEALTNGLPVLATRRGGLPEALGSAGVLFDVPERYTDPARFLEVPAPDEVAEWVQTIGRLWDDEAFYAEHRDRARERARAWGPDRLRRDVEAFFCGIVAGAR